MTRLLASTTTLFVLVASGCGSEPPKATSWAEEANAVCRQALAEIEALEAPTTPEEEARILERYNEIGLELAAKLRRLSPSPSEREKAQRMTEAYAAVIPVQERMARAIRRGDAAAVDRFISKMQRLGSEGDRLAIELGADECAREAFEEEPDPDVG